ncbi:iron complex transport system substrate-binding protein [Conyzicola lurida]|uniref:Iron complex transport system substrate-binding protein n=1 Tax=Conyzicola lurida TaxID=1172621 RepID=A0A841APH5_9MICO|nr:iron-siderophore ABC transporter substrate-binding protein [Conyzicola lurida]MBB5843455.1 iron complex transport system substrate-binding protein [Conyzicola lurida]
MRSTRIGIAAVVLAALTLSACSTGASSTEESDDSPTTTTAGTFPATVDTKFGEVTIDEQPLRIVALGWGDAETVLALGGQPVGASDWLGFGGDGVGPWAEGMYEESPEIIATLEPSYEAIAALEPDLILDTKSSGDQDRYDRLSEIATTVGVPEGGDSYLTTTEQQVELIAGALGLPDEGDALLADVDAAFETVATEHPEWDGLTVAAATKTSEGWGAYIEGSGRVSYLEHLGFVQSPAIAAIETNAGGFSVDISSENLDVIDADLIVAFPIFIDTTEITEDPQWLAVPAVEAGHAVVIDGDISSAYSLGTTLATQYSIDTLVPLLEEATAE